METPRSTTTGQLHIDLGALVENYQRLDHQTLGAEVAAVVKADAYGLGVAEVAPALLEAGCRTFYVAEVGEATTLRAVLDQHGSDDAKNAEILVFAGAQPGTTDELLAQRATPVLIDPGQVSRWAAAATTQRRRGALHVDTGISRTGFDQPGLDWLARKPAELDRLEIVAVLSHLACADELDPEPNRQQLARFVAIRQQFPQGFGSLANTAGIALGPDYFAEQVRPGIGLYGSDPSPNQTLGLAPVVSLHAPVVQVRDVNTGDGVGYGATHRMTAPGRLAVLGVGYADGFPRSLSGRGSVVLHGYRLPIVGRVSMDLTTVDISNLPEGLVQPGDHAELIGPTVSIDDVATDAGTIAYEILTNLGRRYERTYRS